MVENYFQTPSSVFVLPWLLTFVESIPLIRLHPTINIFQSFCYFLTLVHAICLMKYLADTSVSWTLLPRQATLL